ncbi:MAG: hypothetical protein ABIW38_08850 [Ferruginibacter sp.]
MNNNFRFKTKMILMLCIGIPLMGISQVKNVVTTNRVFPKVDKVLEFEKALASHAKKYHTGDTKWRVFEIQSGNDAGGFQITEGPSSWEALDTRGNLGDEHNIDWNKNVTIYLTDRGSSTYSVYQDSLSTVSVGDYSDKINITHVYPKMGYGNKIIAAIKKLRVAWVAEGSSVAVYVASSSGPTQYAIVTRYKQGLKERAQGFRKPFKATYEGIYGEGSWEDYQDDIRQYANDAWSELLFYRADLSSK